ncbi:hypothetical protein AZE42_09277 [Rhizopogon vesiculosus]|uniref:Uncharacterized protein n=1 Tax=Rhizopogon vesiculosus TaxID=180088 RepID=A0A1J8QWU8_9AGAM|nr:hypothetical protein AZE42_09277 [Rhizopogon vesiculosus]
MLFSSIRGGTVPKRHRPYLDATVLAKTRRSLCIKSSHRIPWRLTL